MGEPRTTQATSAKTPSPPTTKGTRGARNSHAGSCVSDPRTGSPILPYNGLRLTCRTPWTTLHRPAARREATTPAQGAELAAGRGRRQPKAAGGQVQPLVGRHSGPTSRQHVDATCATALLYGRPRRLAAMCSKAGVDAATASALGAFRMKRTSTSSRARYPTSSWCAKSAPETDQVRTDPSRLVGIVFPSAMVPPAARL